MALNNYTLGRGRIHIARLDKDQNPGDFRYVGNTPAFNLALETDRLTLPDSDKGLGEIIRSVPRTVTRTATLTMDDIQTENVALFLLGDAQALAIAADTADQTHVFTASQVLSLRGRRDNSEWVPIGVTKENPVGARNLASLTLSGLTADDDYEVDLKRGLFRLKNNSTVAAITALTATYRRKADTTQQITSGSEAVLAAVKFFQNNAAGVNRDYTFPVVSMTPNGEWPQKSDEASEMPFTLDIQQPLTDGVAAIYVNEIEFTG